MIQMKNIFNSRAVLHSKLPSSCSWLPKSSFREVNSSQKLKFVHNCMPRLNITFRNFIKQPLGHHKIIYIPMKMEFIKKALDSILYIIWWLHISCYGKVKHLLPLRLHHQIQNHKQQRHQPQKLRTDDHIAPHHR